MNGSYCIENYAVYNSIEKKALSRDGVFDLIEEGLCDEGALRSVDFESCADTFSSLKTVVFTPERNSGRHPRLDIQIIDPDYKVHHLDSVPSSPDYCIVDGLFLVLDPAQTEDVDQVFKGKHSGAIEYSLLASLYKLDKSFVEFISDNDACPEISTVTAVSGNPAFPLYKYQEVGATWINSVISEGVGCVLADEMGLGKTPQIISVLTANAANGVSLVIVPNTLKENWRRELAKFSPALTVFVYEGKNRFKYYKKLKEYDVVVTSYDTACSDFSIFRQIEWNLIVLDEAQAIKNEGTKRSRLIRGFQKKSGIAVSGTPFENHVTDVWSIFDFCFPSLLGSFAQYKQAFKDDIESATHIEKIISPLLLRRRVSEVRKDLPEKVIIDKVLEMDDSEASMYEEIRAQSSNQNGKLNLGALQRLRQFCALPSIVVPELQDELPIDTSAKFSVLVDILNEIYSRKEKALIFTSWIPAQMAIKDFVENVYGASCYLENGSVAQDMRQTEVDNFSAETGFSVMVLNPTVGGAGLNITAANHVIFYTLDWNPSLEKQCIGRAARSGQTKTVMVYRLYYSNTVEDVMNDRIIKKNQLSEAIVKGTEGDEEADILRALAASPFTKGGDTWIE